MIFAMHGRKDRAHTITFFNSISMFTAEIKVPYHRFFGTRRIGFEI